MTTKLHFQYLPLLNLKLQTKKIFIHVIKTPKLHQNHILSSYKLLFSPLKINLPFTFSL